MTTDANSTMLDFLDALDLEAIAAPNDKLRECEFFFALACVGVSREPFRWLVTAFLNAVYSFSETSALYANVATTDSVTGRPIPDDETLEILRAYVKVKSSSADPYGADEVLTLKL